MSLKQWAIDLAQELRNEAEITITHASMPYRRLLATVIETHIASASSEIIEGLLNELFGACNQLGQANAKIAEMQFHLEKPNRVIQSAPKKGKK